MPPDDAQERSEEATPKRIEDARRRGQVARSKELVTLTMMATAIGASALFGSATTDALAAVMRNSFAPTVLPSGIGLLEFLGQQVLDVFIAATPLLAAMGVASFLATVAVGGWIFSGEAFQFDFQRIDPIKGLGRVFSLRTVVELLKASLKFLLVGGIAASWLWFNAEAFIELDSTSVEAALRDYLHLLAAVGMAMLAPLVLIAGIDTPFQIWNHGKQLRMTRRELKDDMKDSEGNPELKGKLRRRQQEVAQQRMMADVPGATVVVTNPTHFAVALRYDKDSMRAPILVAKGGDLVATAIGSLAREHRVPIIEAPPLARALFHNVKLGETIPEALYLAVAKVLAYVHDLRRSGVRISTPRKIRGITVPPEFERTEA